MFDENICVSDVKFYIDGKEYDLASEVKSITLNPEPDSESVFNGFLSNEMSGSGTININPDYDLKRYIKNLTPKSDRRLIHNLFYSKCARIRKKAFKRLIEKGYKIAYSI